MGKLAAVVAAVLLGWATVAGATTLEITSGGLSSDTLSRDLFGGYGGPSFNVQGIGFAHQVLSFGLAFIINELASGHTGRGTDQDVRITVAGLGSCLVDVIAPCRITLDLRSEPFTMPPPTAEFHITVPFTATGHLIFGANDFDLVGNGRLTVSQQCCGFPGIFVTTASYTFVPESPSLVLTIFGLSLPIAASLVNLGAVASLVRRHGTDVVRRHDDVVDPNAV